MTFALTFLTASLPLTKKIEKLADGTLYKTPYPMVANFTSETVPIKDITEFHKHLLNRASSAKKPCLLKGTLATPLVMESRKGTTNTNDSTSWVCLDIDDAKFSSPEEVMRALGLETISYVVQYSSSYKLGTNKNLSCHIFFILSKAVAAPQLKAWLMHLNLTVAALETTITLSKSNASLHWPLDISTCQNDKLIYTAHPIFKGMESPIRNDERIQLVIKKNHLYDVSKMELKPIESLKLVAKEKLNDLRTKAGIAPLKVKSKMVGEYEVQTGVGEIAAYEVIDCGEYNRLNLNGGDSQAYWHPKSDATYLHNFKGEASLLLKEVLPNYYADLVRNAKANDATPSAQGDLLLAFREKVTASYWKGTWNPTTLVLDINTVKSELQLDHFLQGHGRSLGAFIPEWQIIFDPQNPLVVDEDNKIINTFLPTAFMRQGKKNKKGDFPVIQRVLDSAVGTGEVQTHFLNWLAVVWQQKRKPLTAWVLHGTEGCLAPETQIVFRRGKRNAGRALTIEEAYEKSNGIYRLGTGRGKTWDMSIPTYAHCVKDEKTVGYSEVIRIVQSGVKMLYRVVTEDGGLIRVTHEHPFMRPDGSFTKLCDLAPGDLVLKRGEKNCHALTLKGRNKQRKTIHSIPHHPYAWKHTINGKNYKRMHQARLVFEADMNGVSLEYFIRVLRNDAGKAATFEYLDPSIIVHHLDEDCTNDALGNLTTVAKDNHDAFHAQNTGLGTVPTISSKILSITQDREEMTYDMTMKAPYHNYVANGFCVSNTGKGVLFHDVLRPLFGKSHAVQKRATELGSQFNGWLEPALIVFIDEIDADMFVNAKAVEADLRTLITEPTVSIRRMRTDSYEVPNYSAFIFSSNKKRPVAIPSGDRRFNIGVFQRDKLVISQEEINSISGELEAFAHHLSLIKADFHTAKTVLQTEDRKAVQKMSVTSVDQLANSLVAGDLMALWEAMPDEELMEAMGSQDNTASAYAYLVRRCSREETSKLSRDELAVIFKHCIGIETKTLKFAALLRHHGIETKKFRVGNKSAYGLTVTWTVSKEDREFLREDLTSTQKLKRVK